MDASHPPPHPAKPPPPPLSRLDSTRAKKKNAAAAAPPPSLPIKHSRNHSPTPSLPQEDIAPAPSVPESTKRGTVAATHPPPLHKDNTATASILPLPRPTKKPPLPTSHPPPPPKAASLAPTSPSPPPQKTSCHHPPPAAPHKTPPPQPCRLDSRKSTCRRRHIIGHWPQRCHGRVGAVLVLSGRCGCAHYCYRRSVT